MTDAKSCRVRGLTLLLYAVAAVLLAFGVAGPEEIKSREGLRELLSLSRALAVMLGIAVFLTLIVIEWRRTWRGPQGPG